MTTRLQGGTFIDYRYNQDMKPRKYTGIFTYGARQVRFHFWASEDGNNPAKPDCILFLGAGQVGAIPRWVAKAAGAGVVVVDGLPHWAVEPSVDAVTAFSIGYIAAAFAAVRKTFQANTLHVIAESQAAPASIIVAHRETSHIANVVLVRPLGLSVQSFGASEAERMQVFRRRVLRTMLQFPQSFLHDPRNFGVVTTMLRAASREPNIAALTKKYAIGISYDLQEDCKAVARLQAQKGRQLTILLGAKDKLFPPHEVLSMLKDVAAITTQVVPRTTHASLAVRGGTAILQAALRAARGQAN